MVHEMRLNDEPFQAIKDGTKTIEMRLYDEKRRMIQVGDVIRFTNRETSEELFTKVIALHIFENFQILYAHFDKESLGYQKNDVALATDMNQYYSMEEQTKYGVVGIEIEVTTE